MIDGSYRVSRFAFTLAEVTLGLGLLAIIALGLLGLFVSSGASSQGGTARIEAINLASAELDHWKHLPYPELVGYLTSPPAPYDRQFREKPYRLTLQVSRADSNPNKLEYSLLELKLTISWEQKDKLNQDGISNLGAGTARRSQSLFTLVAPGASN
ncbi:hypothetical protein JST97_35775 [bacterium]|nr:hypothetical protein [bacterium]